MITASCEIGIHKFIPAAMALRAMTWYEFLIIGGSGCETPSLIPLALEIIFH